MMNKNSDKGFTMLEVAIAITIFGFLMLYISQLMHNEIKLYGQAVKKNEIEQKARIAMMHVLDQTRLKPNTYYWVDGNPPGVYYYDSDLNKTVCLIKAGIQTSVDTTDDQVIYLVGNKLYRGKSVITDDVKQFIIEQVTTYLIKIDIVIQDPDTLKEYELLTWARL